MFLTYLNTHMERNLQFILAKLTRVVKDCKRINNLRLIVYIVVPVGGGRRMGCFTHTCKFEMESTF